MKKRVTQNKKKKMEKKKDVLECYRSWNKELNDIDDFLQQWFAHEEAQGRLDIYYQLRQWGEDYSYWDIETVIELVCMLWDKVQKNEKGTQGRPSEPYKKPRIPSMSF